MRILQLCSKPPLPSVDGGTLAMLAAANGLLACGNELKILAIATDKHPFLPEKISPEFKSSTSIESVFIDTIVKRKEAFINLFSETSYIITRFYSIEFEQKLISILSENKFDIIQLESLFLAPYFDVIRKFSKGKIVLRAHNVESELWKRRTAQEKNPLYKTWFKNLTKKLSRFEKDILNKVDALVPITKEDEKMFSEMLGEKKISTHVLPFAMKSPELNSRIIPKRNSVFHIGSMDWAPNSEGVNWLVKEIWPLVLAKNPNAELHLAGKGLRKEDENYSGQNITNHGEVKNAFDFMNEYSVMTIPLLSGGGMRVKLVEGMFLGKPIVSTSIGAEGTAVVNEQNILIENSPEKFADAICKLLSDDSFAKKLGDQAKIIAQSDFEIVSASKKLTDFYTTLLK
jgi:glycosyltransferase involved in cell wall biosynthesis